MGVSIGRLKARREAAAAAYADHLRKLEEAITQQTDVEGRVGALLAAAAAATDDGNGGVMADVVRMNGTRLVRLITQNTVAESNVPLPEPVVQREEIPHVPARKSRKKRAK